MISYFQLILFPNGKVRIGGAHFWVFFKSVCRIADFLVFYAENPVFNGTVGAEARRNADKKGQLHLI